MSEIGREAAIKVIDQQATATANIAAIHCSELRCQNQSFIQLFCGTHE